MESFNQETFKETLRSLIFEFGKENIKLHLPKSWENQYDIDEDIQAYTTDNLIKIEVTCEQETFIAFSSQLGQ